MTETQARERFQRWVDAFPLKQDAAMELGISAPYLTELYRGTRPLTAKILAHIGLVREVIIKARTA